MLRIALALFVFLVVALSPVKAVEQSLTSASAAEIVLMILTAMVIISLHHIHRRRGATR